MNSVQFTNNHHNIAVNVTLNLPLKEKQYSKSKTISTVQQHGKSAREPIKTEAIHSHFAFIDTALTRNAKPRTHVRDNGNFTGMCWEKTYI